VCMLGPLLQDGISTSSMIKDGLLRRKDRSLQFRANLITKEDKL
jgi:hypothetical protein